MTNEASFTDAEKRTFARLRSSYEAAGFTFVAAPTADSLPDFFHGFRPDAIARKGDRNIAFEIVGRDRWETADPFALQRLVEGQPNWQFNVVVAPRQDVGPLIGRTSIESIRARRGEALALAQGGHREVAFALGWALLEAALHADGDALESRPMTAGGVLEGLARMGYVEPATERRLHPLVTLRDRVVHGDLSAAVTMDHVSAVLGAVDEALMVEPT